MAITKAIYASRAIVEALISLWLIFQAIMPIFRRAAPAEWSEAATWNILILSS